MATNTAYHTRFTTAVESYLNRTVLGFLIFAALADVVATYASLHLAEPLLISMSGTHEILGQPMYYAGEMEIGAAEGNPLMAPVLSGYGFGAAVVLKGVSIVAIVVIPLLGRDRPSTFYYGGLLAGSFWLVAAIVNCLPIFF